jgi:hypothetical protein
MLHKGLVILMVLFTLISVGLAYFWSRSARVRSSVVVSKTNQYSLSSNCGAFELRIERLDRIYIPRIRSGPQDRSRFLGRVPFETKLGFRFETGSAVLLPRPYPAIWNIIQHRGSARLTSDQIVDGADSYGLPAALAIAVTATP